MNVYCYRSTCKDFDAARMYPIRGVFSVQRYKTPVDISENGTSYGEVWFDRPLFPDETYAFMLVPYRKHEVAMEGERKGERYVNRL